MIKYKQVFIKQLVLLIDMASIIVAFLFTYYFRGQIHHFYHLNLITARKVLTPLRTIEDYLWLLLIILPIWLGVLHMMGAYHQMRTKTPRQISKIILKASLVGVLLFGSAVFLLRLQYVSRTFIILFSVFGFLMLSCERAILMAYWHVLARMEYFQKKLLVVGTGNRAQVFIRSVRQNPSWGIRIVGILDRDPTLVGLTIESTEIIGTLDDLGPLLRQHVVDEVVFVVPRSWMSEIEEPILQCERVGVRATLAADLFNVNVAKAQSSELEGMPVISFDTTPADQWQLAIKRIGDLFASLLGIMFLSPLFLVVGAVIKASSPGPIFFRQIRCGINGRIFMLYKFRTMEANAEDRKAEVEHLNEMVGPIFKATNDPRLTKFGKWLRKTSIDELPQLFNVLKGEMSLVGPRPPIPSEVENYEVWHRRRLSMRPGITGQWQVQGRNRIKNFNDWMRLDLEYIDRWSLVLDMKILLKTIPATLLAIGAK